MKFKVGDRVKVRHPASIFDNLKGVVEKIVYRGAFDNPDKPPTIHVYVLLDGWKTSVSFAEHVLELIEIDYFMEALI